MAPVINIQNYEEYFLLYVDGELSADESRAVEQFVQENPHLAPELDMLLQVKLEPEELVLEDKEALFRNGADEIDAANCETHFLLYVDDELSAPQRQKVETFVLQHPSTQEAFMQLKQAKLEPEHIPFPDKASLYRREEKERRVVFMRWQRLAVAAAITGLAVLVWTLIPGGKTGGPDNSMVAQAPNTAATQQPGTVTGSRENSSQQPADETRAATVTAANNPAEKTVTPQANTIDRSTVPNEKAQEATQAVIARVDPPVTNNTISGEQEEVVTTRTNPATMPPVTQQVSRNNAAAIENTEIINAHNTEPANTMAMTAQPAVYKELDTQDVDDKKSLYLGSIEINKDKLRGFFRKATSLFRGKAKEEEKTETAPPATRSLR